MARLCTLPAKTRAGLPESSWSRVRRLPATHQSDDFVAVVGLHLRLLPKVTRKNIEVALNRDTVGRHLEVVEQRRDGEAVGNFAAVAIDRDRHSLVCSKPQFTIPF